MLRPEPYGQRDAWCRRDILDAGHATAAIALEMHVISQMFAGRRIKAPHTVVAGNAVSEGKGDEVEVALLLMPLVLRYATVSEETLTKPINQIHLLMSKKDLLTRAYLTNRSEETLK